MRTPSPLHFAGLYLSVWFGIFGTAIFLDDQAMAWIVASSAGMPPWLVTLAGWLPCGLAVLLLGLGNVVRPQNPVKGTLGGSIALCGLAVAAQTPVAFNRHSSDFYESLAGTPEGGAFIAGAFWAWFPFVAAALLFVTARWVLHRLAGGTRRFRDVGLARTSSNMRIMGAAAIAISLGSLAGAMLTA